MVFLKWFIMNHKFEAIYIVLAFAVLSLSSVEAFLVSNVIDSKSYLYYYVHGILYLCMYCLVSYRKL